MRCLCRFRHFAVMIQFGAFKDTFVCSFIWLFARLSPASSKRPDTSMARISRGHKGQHVCAAGRTGQRSSQIAAQLQHRAEGGSPDLINVWTKPNNAEIRCRIRIRIRIWTSCRYRYSCRRTMTGSRWPIAGCQLRVPSVRR